MSNLTSEQVEAITHAWLAVQEVVHDSYHSGLGDQKDRHDQVVEELEQAFPWLLEKPDLDP